MKSKTPDPVRSSTVGVEQVGGDSPRLSRSSNENAVDPGAEEVAAFKPSSGLYIAFVALAVITLMVALDGTSLSVSLPVGFSSPPQLSLPNPLLGYEILKNSCSDSGSETQWHGN